MKQNFLLLSGAFIALLVGTLNIYSCTAAVVDYKGIHGLLALNTIPHEEGLIGATTKANSCPITIQSLPYTIPQNGCLTYYLGNNITPGGDLTIDTANSSITGNITIDLQGNTLNGNVVFAGNNPKHISVTITHGTITGGISWTPVISEPPSSYIVSNYTVILDTLTVSDVSIDVILTGSEATSKINVANNFITVTNNSEINAGGVGITVFAGHAGATGSITDNNIIIEKNSIASGITIREYPINANYDQNNKISLNSNSLIKGDIELLAGSSGASITVDGSTVGGIIYPAGIFESSTITLQNNAVVFGDIVGGNIYGSTLLVKNNSILFGCYNLSGDNITVTVAPDSIANACPNSYKKNFTFVEWGCCSNNNLGDTIFAGDGQVLYAFLENQAYSKAYLVSTAGYSDQAFYWINNNQALAAIQTSSGLAFVIYDKNQNTFTNIPFEQQSSLMIDGKPLASKQQVSALTQVGVLAWHVNNSGGQWDQQQQYLATCYSMSGIITNLTGVFSVDTETQPGKIILKQVNNAGWVAPLANQASYITWQPTNQTDFPLILVAVDYKGSNIVAVPVNLAGQEAGINFVKPTLAPAGESLPQKPVIFATPQYLYVAGLYGGKQQLRRYTVTAPTLSEVDFNNEEKFFIDLPVEKYGTIQKLRCCNGGAHDPLFISTSQGSPTGEQTVFFRVDNLDQPSNFWSITGYPAPNVNAAQVLFSDLAPLCPGESAGAPQYNLAGLLQDVTNAYQIIAYDCASTGCAINTLFPIPS